MVGKVKQAGLSYWDGVNRERLERGPQDLFCVSGDVQWAKDIAMETALAWEGACTWVAGTFVHC